MKYLPLKYPGFFSIFLIMEVNECGGGEGVVSSRIYTFFLTWRIKSLQVLFLKLNEAKMQNGISAMVSAI